MPKACDYTNWRIVNEYEPEPGRFVLIGTKLSYPMVGVRKSYTKGSVEFVSNEFRIPSSGNSIRSLKLRPLYWMPIEGC